MPAWNPPRSLPPKIDLAHWPDEETERSGHLVMSTYVEHFWLPILGPSATWMARRLAVFTYCIPDRTSGGRIAVDTIDLALSLGMRQAELGRNSPVARTLRRLITFGIVRADLGEGEYSARSHLPIVDDRRLERLPASLREQHAAVMR